MNNKYAYFCDTTKCTDCSFPECAHTTDENYIMYKEGNDKTEMRFIYTIDNVNYYMEFVKHPFLDKKLNIQGRRKLNEHD